MPAIGYAPLPTQQPSPEADRELDAAFADDDDDDDDELYQSATALSTSRSPPLDTAPKGSSTPPTYDFERDFDYVRPPPGSPPRPSAVALPNDFGNSNGLLPSEPVCAPTRRRPSFIRRAIGAVLPTHYARVPTTTDVVVGGGTQNDGVFANVTAKPCRPVQAHTEDGSTHIMPEETQTSAPPSYAAAQADAVPPYWETTIHAPAGLDSDAGMIIDDLPSGSIFVFVINFFTSFFFQFVGFVLTYLLHTTHAAKFGSRAGLGLTLIQFGFYSRAGENGSGSTPGMMMMGGEEGVGPDGSEDSVGFASSDPMPADSAFLNISSREWLSFLFMTLGWFILLSSLIGFWRIKHWEASIRATQARAPPSSEEIERDIATRQTLETMFRLSGTDDPESQQVICIPSRLELEEARLHRDLRSAGLL